MSATSDTVSTTVISEKRLRANRRNSLKSTGPRTVEGKKRVGQNAVQHGLCKQHGTVGDECGTTYLRHQAELREELRPGTALQERWFSEICYLYWQLDRLRDIERGVYNEMQETGEPVCEVMAKAFVEDPSNPFERLSRYGHRMRTQLMKLLRAYDYEKKRVEKDNRGYLGELRRVPRERAINHDPVFTPEELEGYARQLQEDEAFDAAIRAKMAAEEAAARQAAEDAAAAARADESAGEVEDREIVSDESVESNDEIAKQSHCAADEPPAATDEPSRSAEEKMHGTGEPATIDTPLAPINQGVADSSAHPAGTSGACPEFATG